jgi:hypothetical protein
MHFNVNVLYVGTYVRKSCVLAGPYIKLSVLERFKTFLG